MRNTSAVTGPATLVETRAVTASPAAAESVETYSCTSPVEPLRPDLQDRSPGSAFSVGMGLGRSKRNAGGGGGGGGSVPPSGSTPGGCSRHAPSNRTIHSHHRPRPIDPPPQPAGEGKDADHLRQCARRPVQRHGVQTTLLGFVAQLEQSWSLTSWRPRQLNSDGGVPRQNPVPSMAVGQPSPGWLRLMSQVMPPGTTAQPSGPLHGSASQCPSRHSRTESWPSQW